MDGDIERIENLDAEKLDEFIGCWKDHVREDREHYTPGDVHLSDQARAKERNNFARCGVDIYDPKVRRALFWVTGWMTARVADASGAPREIAQLIAGAIMQDPVDRLLHLLSDFEIDAK